jgi:hypothetical protein
VLFSLLYAQLGDGFDTGIPEIQVIHTPGYPCAYKGKKNQASNRVHDKTCAYPPEYPAISRMPSPPARNRILPRRTGPCRSLGRSDRQSTAIFRHFSPFSVT